MEMLTRAGEFWSTDGCTAQSFWGQKITAGVDSSASKRAQVLLNSFHMLLVHRRWLVGIAQF
jgi:hypothetical protein